MKEQEHCLKTGKVRYPNGVRARAIVDSMARCGFKAWFYKCKWCGGYHLTREDQQCRK